MCYISSRYACRLERCLWGLIPQRKGLLFYPQCPWRIILERETFASLKALLNGCAVKDGGEEMDRRMFIKCALLLRDTHHRPLTP